MKTVLQIFVGIPIMIGLWYFCRWLAVGISKDFGEGVYTGMMLILVLFWLVSKVDPTAFQRRDKEL